MPSQGNSDIRQVRPGDAGVRPTPFTIVIVANPALEAPWNSGAFVVDPIMANRPAFDAAVQYIDRSLFGGLPQQQENLLADQAIAPHICVVSVWVQGLNAEDGNALVAQDGVSDILVARRSMFVPFLDQFELTADVAYAVSASPTHTRASAWFTSDDTARGGVAFTLDGVNLQHAYFNLVPGTVGIHTTSNSLVALHEFGHALSSYENGSVVDLYVDSGPGFNNKRGRPIPVNFAAYDGVTYRSDQTRDGLGYPAGWQSYHCELTAPAYPAVMDNFWQAPGGPPERCMHDRITRQFLRDRLLAKFGR